MRKIKVLYSTAKILMFSGFGLWFIETLIFQIIYGYHWLPYNEVELYFDRASGWLFFCGLVLLIYTFSEAVKKLIDKL